MPGGPSLSGGRPASPSGGRFLFFPAKLPGTTTASRIVPIASNPMLIDSHCHLTDPRYQDDRRDVLIRAREAGIQGVISVCSHARDTEQLRALLADSAGDEQVPALWGTAGIHPHDAQDARDGDLDRIREVAAEGDDIVAVGETGLDFFYDLSPRALQEELFRAHLEMAEALDLPIVVHSRSADRRTMEILRERGHRVRGVLHCFTGGEELLRQALSVGWMISFTGIITFRNYDGEELLRMVPQDRLMVETDGPYLAPIPHRGKRNEPAFVVRVAREMARIRQEDPEAVAGYTTRNAVDFFRLSI